MCSVSNAKVSLPMSGLPAAAEMMLALTPPAF